MELENERLNTSEHVLTLIDKIKNRESCFSSFRFPYICALFTQTTSKRKEWHKI